MLWGDAAHDSGGARARSQKDFMSGGFGDDTLYAGRGSNNVMGGDGNDYLQGNGVSQLAARRQRRRTTSAWPAATPASTPAPATTP